MPLPAAQHQVDVQLPAVASRVEVRVHHVCTFFMARPVGVFPPVFARLPRQPSAPVQFVTSAVQVEQCGLPQGIVAHHWGQGNSRDCALSCLNLTASATMVRLIGGFEVLWIGDAHAFVRHMH